MLIITIDITEPVEVTKRVILRCMGKTVVDIDVSHA